MTTTITEILPYKLQLEDGEKLGALDDPGPLPEGMHQNPTLLYAATVLLSCLRKIPGLFVDFNTFVYFDRTNRNRRVSPDLYVALGVDVAAIRERHGYLIWEVGKPPDFVLEIASESTAEYDCTGKRDLYASIGIGEYWRYDPTGGDYYGVPLIGEYLVDGEYRPFETHTGADGEIWAHSPLLNIDIYWGDDRLTVYDYNRDRGFMPDSEEMDYRYEVSLEYEKSGDLLTATHAVYEAERNLRRSRDLELIRAQAEIARLQEEMRRQQSE